MSAPILYSFRRCPYAMRARMALIISGQTCALREVALKAKPDAMLEASPKGTVPVLVLRDVTVLEESLDIMHWALSRNDPEDWLGPDPAHRDRLIADNDGVFKHHLDRYKYPNRYDNVDPMEHRAGGLAVLEALNRLLEQRPFLLADRRSLADVALFPFIRQFANTDRDWFDALPLAPLQTWLSRCLESELFAQAMKKVSPWTPGDEEPLLG